MAMSIIGGMLGNLVGNMPDEFWAQMMTESGLPCGQPDCDCEKLRFMLYTALNLLREDFKKETKDQSS